MFENLVNDYLERAKPHVLSAGEIAQSYAERIISRLDAIHESQKAHDEVWDERRVRQIVSGPVGTLADISSWSLVRQIPTGQQWELELVNLYSPAGASSALIAIDNIVALSSNVDASGPGNSRVGVNLPVYGGDTIFVYLSGAATLYLQFNVRTKKPKTQGPYAGTVENPPDRVDARQESQNDRRHFSVSNLEEGINPVGERPASLQGL